MSLPMVINQSSTSGFYQASISKFLFGSLTLSHLGLQLSMFSPFQKYLICKIPDSLNKGEIWRLWTSKCAFLDTKDAIFCMILLYQFRIFERRFGSRKFASHLIAFMSLTGVLEWILTVCVQTLDSKLHSGLLSIGPFGLILPWFVYYYQDIPSLNSTQFLGLRISGKFMTYMLGLQIILGSAVSNGIVAISSLVSAILVKQNWLWIQNWFVVPKIIGDLTQKIFGWLIDSSAPTESGPMGATLEIQRSQQMEAIEQHMQRQQVRMMAARNPLGGAGLRPRGAAAAPEPSEANITLLVDMGFPRQQAVEALREAHNDLSTATSILLRNT